MKSSIYNFYIFIFAYVCVYIYICKYIYIAYFEADFFKATKINMHKNDSDNIQLILTKIIHTEYAVLHR